MTEKNENLKKRGRKGGTPFPRYSLSHMNAFLKALISKTHTATINMDQLSAGVFGIGAKSDIGKIKASAMKQFGLLEGDYTKFKAPELATKIEMSEGVEKITLLQQAFFNVKVFKNAFDTFKNSTIDKGKISQYAVSTLKIHPDMKDEFVKVLVESVEISGLGKSNGNAVTFEQPTIKTETKPESKSEDESPDNNNGENDQSNDDTKNNGAPSEEASSMNSSRQTGKLSNINVNIDVDPSMDPEKLEKLLKLLKNYGAI